MDTREISSQTPSSLPLDAEAVILAGTYHWTGSVFEDLCARPLLPVAQTPVIEYVLTWLNESGIRVATICANGSTGALRGHVQDGAQFGLDVRYHEDRTPRGAAGCVKDASAAGSSQTVVVADGTAVPMVDLRRIVEYHHARGAMLTIVGDRRTAEDGEMLRPVGIYVFNRAALDLVPATSFQDIKEALIPALYRSGHKIEVFAIDQPFPRVMNAATYLAANRWMVQRLGAQPAQAHGASGQLVGSSTAKIHPEAVIVGPVMLGRDVQIMAGATIVGPASIGDGTVVEAGATIARSVVWSNCEIGAHAIVDNSILSTGTVVPAEASVMNAVRAPEPEGRSGARLRPSRQPSLRPTALAKPAWS